MGRCAGVQHFLRGAIYTLYPRFWLCGVIISRGMKLSTPWIVHVSPLNCFRTALGHRCVLGSFPVHVRTAKNKFWYRTLVRSCVLRCIAVIYVNDDGRAVERANTLKETHIEANSPHVSGCDEPVRGVRVSYIIMLKPFISPPATRPKPASRSAANPE